MQNTAGNGNRRAFHYDNHHLIELKICGSFQSPLIGKLETGPIRVIFVLEQIFFLYQILNLFIPWCCRCIAFHVSSM
jgi:hypothetical protein